MGIYLLETGLGKPEFLSVGNARLKKANQLMQKLMEYFYDFIIPGMWTVELSFSFYSFVIFRDTETFRLILTIHDKLHLHHN